MNAKVPLLQQLVMSDTNCGARYSKDLQDEKFKSSKFTSCLVPLFWSQRFINLSKNSRQYIEGGRNVHINT